jgi:hypothetical protein
MADDLPWLQVPAAQPDDVEMEDPDAFGDPLPPLVPEPPQLVNHEAGVAVHDPEWGGEWNPPPVDTWRAEFVHRLLPNNAGAFLGRCTEPVGLTSALDMNLPATLVRLDADNIVRDALFPSAIRNDRGCMDLAASFQKRSCSGSTTATMQHVALHRGCVGSNTIRSGYRHPVAHSGSLPFPESHEQHIPLNGPPTRQVRHPSASGSDSSKSLLTVISACLPRASTPIHPRVREDLLCAHQTPAAYRPPLEGDFDDDGSTAPQPVTDHIHGYQVLLPPDSPLGTAKWSSACPYTYVTRELMQLQGPWGHAQLCFHRGGSVLTECGQTLPYYHILEFLDIHFQESYSVRYSWPGSHPPNPAGIIYTHRLYDVPVVGLPPAAVAPNADAPPLVPCHFCLGNDILDACGWALNPEASIFNVGQSAQLMQTPLGDPNRRNMLQFCAPCLPGQLFMVPTCDVTRQALPPGHPVLDYFQIQQYLHRLCSIISYTCLPMRAHSFSVLSELDIFEYSSSILSTFRYPSDGPDGMRQVVASSLRLPLDPSDVYYPQWQYHMLPRKCPVPPHAPQIHALHHSQGPNIPLVCPPATRRHVATIRATEGQHLRNNERAARAILREFLDANTDDCPIQLYSTSGIQVGWYDNSTRGNGGISSFIGTTAIRRHHRSSYMCHRTWRHPSIVMKTPAMFPEGTNLRTEW